MARRRKKASQRGMNMPTRRMHKCSCSWLNMISGKLWGAALILFLITAWPSATQFVYGIHWGWFLAAIVLLSALHFAKCKRCRM